MDNSKLTEIINNILNSTHKKRLNNNDNTNTPCDQQSDFLDSFKDSLTTQNPDNTPDNEQVIKMIEQGIEDMITQFELSEDIINIFSSYLDDISSILGFDEQGNQIQDNIYDVLLRNDDYISLGITSYFSSTEYDTFINTDVNDPSMDNYGYLWVSPLKMKQGIKEIVIKQFSDVQNEYDKYNTQLLQKVKYLLPEDEQNKVNLTTQQNTSAQELRNTFKQNVQEILTVKMCNNFTQLIKNEGSILSQKLKEQIKLNQVYNLSQSTKQDIQKINNQFESLFQNNLNRYIKRFIRESKNYLVDQWSNVSSEFSIVTNQWSNTLQTGEQEQTKQSNENNFLQKQNIISEQVKNVRKNFVFSIDSIYNQLGLFDNFVEVIQSLNDFNDLMDKFKNIDIEPYKNDFENIIDEYWNGFQKSFSKEKFEIIKDLGDQTLGLNVHYGKVIIDTLNIFDDQSQEYQEIQDNFTQSIIDLYELDFDFLTQDIYNQLQTSMNDFIKNFENEDFKSNLKTEIENKKQYLDDQDIQPVLTSLNNFNTFSFQDKIEYVYDYLILKDKQGIQNLNVLSKQKLVDIYKNDISINEIKTYQEKLLLNDEEYLDYIQTNQTSIDYYFTDLLSELIHNDNSLLVYIYKKLISNNDLEQIQDNLISDYLLINLDETQNVLTQIYYNKRNEYLDVVYNDLLSKHSDVSLSRQNFKDKLLRYWDLSTELEFENEQKKKTTSSDSDVISQKTQELEELTFQLKRLIKGVSFKSIINDFNESVDNNLNSHLNFFMSKLEQLFIGEGLKISNIYLEINSIMNLSNNFDIIEKQKEISTILKIDQKVQDINSNLIYDDVDYLMNELNQFTQQDIDNQVTQYENIQDLMDIPDIFDYVKSVLLNFSISDQEIENEKSKLMEFNTYLHDLKYNETSDQVIENILKNYDIVNSVLKTYEGIIPEEEINKIKQNITDENFDENTIKDTIVHYVYNEYGNYNFIRDNFIKFLFKSYKDDYYKNIVMNILKETYEDYQKEYEIKLEQQFVFLYQILRNSGNINSYEPDQTKIDNIIELIINDNNYIDTQSKIFQDFNNEYKHTNLFLLSILKLYNNQNYSVEVENIQNKLNPTYGQTLSERVQYINEIYYYLLEITYFYQYKIQLFDNLYEIDETTLEGYLPIFFSYTNLDENIYKYYSIFTLYYTNEKYQDELNYYYDFELFSNSELIDMQEQYYVNLQLDNSTIKQQYDDYVQYRNQEYDYRFNEQFDIILNDQTDTIYNTKIGGVYYQLVSDITYLNKVDIYKDTFFLSRQESIQNELLDMKEQNIDSTFKQTMLHQFKYFQYYNSQNDSIFDYTTNQLLSSYTNSVEDQNSYFTNMLQEYLEYKYNSKSISDVLSNPKIEKIQKTISIDTLYDFENIYQQMGDTYTYEDFLEYIQNDFYNNIESDTLEINIEQLFNGLTLEQNIDNYEDVQKSMYQLLNLHNKSMIIDNLFQNDQEKLKILYNQLDSYQVNYGIIYDEDSQISNNIYSIQEDYQRKEFNNLVIIEKYLNSDFKIYSENIIDTFEQGLSESLTIIPEHSKMVDSLLGQIELIFQETNLQVNEQNDNIPEWLSWFRKMNDYVTIYDVLQDIFLDSYQFQFGEEIRNITYFEFLLQMIKSSIFTYFDNQVEDIPEKFNQIIEYNQDIYYEQLRFYEILKSHVLDIQDNTNNLINDYDENNENSQVSQLQNESIDIIKDLKDTSTQMIDTIKRSQIS